MNIRNNHNAVLYVAGKEIRPGATVAIDNWDVIKLSTQTKALIEGKYIEEIDPPETPKAKKGK